jgi:TonB family protein
MKNKLGYALAIVALCIISLTGVEARLQVGLNHFKILEKSLSSLRPMDSPQLLNPEVLDQIPYPESCRELGIEGKVKLKFLVGKNGRVIRGSVQSTPHLELGEACLRVLDRLQFIPGLDEDQEPVECWVSIVVHFELEI